MSTPSATGPDFISFQVRDLERAAAFYSEVIGLPRVPAPSPDAVVFGTGAGSAAFAVRRPFPGTDLDAATPFPGHGSGVWFHDADPAAVHRRAVDAGATVVTEPFDSPFGTQFTVADPDGYRVTVHGTR
jgi:predicted enzyme related to lactoylglutathione lyase